MRLVGHSPPLASVSQQCCVDYEASAPSPPGTSQVCEVGIIIFILKAGIESQGFASLPRGILLLGGASVPPQLTAR